MYSYASCSGSVSVTMCVLNNVSCYTMIWLLGLYDLRHNFECAHSRLSVFSLLDSFHCCFCRLCFLSVRFLLSGV